MAERRRRSRSRIETDIVLEGGAWPDAGEVGTLIEAAAAEVAAEPRFELGTVQVAIALAGDDQVAVLNGNFRGKSKPTNVLSFPSGPGMPEDYLGDIVLGYETIVREAQEQDVSFEHHLQHLVVHGLLHLLGKDHENPADAERMEALEIKILARLGIANPYTAPLEPGKTL